MRSVSVYPCWEPLLHLPRLPVTLSMVLYVYRVGVVPKDEDMKFSRKARVFNPCLSRLRLYKRDGLKIVLSFQRLLTLIFFTLSFTVYSAWICGGKVAMGMSIRYLSSSLLYITRRRSLLGLMGSGLVFCNYFRVSHASVDTLEMGPLFSLLARPLSAMFAPTGGRSL